MFEIVLSSFLNEAFYQQLQLKFIFRAQLCSVVVFFDAFEPFSRFRDENVWTLFFRREAEIFDRLPQKKKKKIQKQFFLGVAIEKKSR